MEFESEYQMCLPCHQEGSAGAGHSPEDLSNLVADWSPDRTEGHTESGGPEPGWAKALKFNAWFRWAVVIFCQQAQEGMEQYNLFMIGSPDSGHLPC